jgi:integrase
LIDRHYSAREVAELLGVSLSSAYQIMRDAGAITEYLGHSSTAMVERVYGRLQGKRLGEVMERAMRGGGLLDD